MGAVTNPATGEVIAEVPYATEADIDRAVRAAHEAFLKWREVPVVDRVQVLYRYKDAARKTRRRNRRASSPRENGKTIDDARAEVRRLIQMVEVACGMPSLMMGDSLNDVAAGIDCKTIRQPIGVCAGITPFNFPAMVPMWMYPFAIACGNTFVLKPSEKVPLTPTRAIELLHDAGLPPGVLNLVHGGKEAVDAPAAPSAGQGRLIRRLHARGQVHLHHCRRRGQARAGAGRRQESPGGHARCRYAEDRRSDHRLGFRRRRRALSGGQCAGAGGRCRRSPARLTRRSARKSLAVGDGSTDRHRNGPAGDRRSLRARWPAMSKRAWPKARPRWWMAAPPSLSGGGFFLGPTIFDHVTPEMTIARRRDLRPGAFGDARQHAGRRHQPGEPLAVRQRHRHLHRATANPRASTPRESKSAWWA